MSGTTCGGLSRNQTALAWGVKTREIIIDFGRIKCPHQGSLDDGVFTELRRDKYHLSLNIVRIAKDGLFETCLTIQGIFLVVVLPECRILRVLGVFT
jgi:hypothetical protein